MKASCGTNGDPRLDDVVFEVSEEKTLSNPIEDRETGVVIPGVVRANFSLSVPYSVGEGVHLANKTSIAPRDFFHTWDSMTEETARDLAETYLRDNVRPVKVVIRGVIPAVYPIPQEAPQGGHPRNAFEVRGLVYKLGSFTKGEGYPFSQQ